MWDGGKRRGVDETTHPHIDRYSKSHTLQPWRINEQKMALYFTKFNVGLSEFCVTLQLDFVWLSLVLSGASITFGVGACVSQSMHIVTASSETQGQLVGAKGSKSGKEIKHRITCKHAMLNFFARFTSFRPD